jgi:hypothetical protein
MAITSRGYNISTLKMGTKLYDPGTDTVRVMLLKAESTVPDNPDHVFVSDIVADEADFTNYARKTLASVTVAQDDTLDVTKIDHEDLVYTSAGGTLDNSVVALVRYTFVTNDADSWLMEIHAVSFTTDGGNVTLQVATDGAVQISG